MNDYDKQAADFLRKTGTTLSILDRAVTDRFPEESKASGLRWKYHVRLQRNRKQYTFHYYGSVYDYNNGNDLRPYDVLACFQKYDVGTFEDFCSEFGFNDRPLSDFPLVKKQYNAVRREYAAVCRLFGDVLEDLQEIY